MGCVGIEIDTHTIRGVRLEAWRGGPARLVEMEWDHANPAEAGRALRASLGRARRVGVAVRLPLLFAKRVKLPPLPPDERRRVIQIEPQRFFPVRTEDVVVAVGRGDFVFAAREAPLAGWVRALEELGPLDLVEPGPAAMARALDSAGISDCVAVLDDAEHGVAVIDIRNGAVQYARRLYGSLAEAAPTVATAGGFPPPTVYVAPWDDERARTLAARLTDRTLEPLPTIGSVPAAYLAAYGAALGVGRGLDETLLPDELKARIGARRRRELATAALLCVSAATFALVSIDARRTRMAREMEASVQSLKERAVPALALQNELAALARRSDAIAQIEAARPDPLLVLQALSKHLPAGAHLRSMALSGADWQIDGYAARAAEVTQSLGNTPAFQDVHFLSATNRARIGDRTYESFSVAFRFIPTP